MRQCLYVLRVSSRPNAAWSNRAYTDNQTLLWGEITPCYFKNQPKSDQKLHLRKGLSLQKSTEIIKLIKYPPTLFNLSHLLEGYVPLFSNFPISQNPNRQQAVSNLPPPPGRVVPNAPHAPPHPLSTICRRPPSPDGRILASDLLPKIRIQFGTILSLLMRR